MTSGSRTFKSEYSREQMSAARILGRSGGLPGGFPMRTDSTIEEVIHGHPHRFKNRSECKVPIADAVRSPFSVFCVMYLR
jgi:hypothetical protein